MTVCRYSSHICIHRNSDTLLRYKRKLLTVSIYDVTGIKVIHEILRKELQILYRSRAVNISTKQKIDAECIPFMIYKQSIQCIAESRIFRRSIKRNAVGNRSYLVAYLCGTVIVEIVISVCPVLDTTVFHKHTEELLSLFRSKVKHLFHDLRATLLIPFAEDIKRDSTYHVISLADNETPHEVR